MSKITIERPAGAEVKTWGWAEPLWEQTEIVNGVVRVIARGVRVFIEQGGYSSIHLHAGCTNIFSVNQGRLKLRKFKKSMTNNIPLVEWVQEPCDHPASMYPGDPHQFVALTDVLALEVYIATADGDASICNITRFSENGVLKT